jgi:MoaA/NifB/PqqE/SkfB family radical SAM enzyme
MIYDFKEIQHVHLEISSMCNAECPLCPRNFYGYPINNGYKEHAMTLQEAEKIFQPNFLLHLKSITINGNFGDIVMCPDAVKIISYFRQHNPSLTITISTNGGARNQQFWTDLAKLNCYVHFCLDGLEDTHSIYRRNTRYNIVIDNAKTFISAGGVASWKFIVFDHNHHQIEAARELSKQLKFAAFILVDNGRDQGPVFNAEKKLDFYLGKLPEHEVTFEKHYAMYYNLLNSLDKLSPPKPNPVKCKVKEDKSIYVNSLGEVYPCCWLGFNPKTFGGTQHFKITNSQLRPLISDNDALNISLEHTIKWFDRVEDSWSKSTYQDGLLYTCNHVCA